VLTAMGVPDPIALGAIRVSVSMQNSVEEIEELAKVLEKEANRFSHLLNR
jgi:cysteine desulfurase